jgi:small GTP-binding protein
MGHGGSHTEHHTNTVYAIPPETQKTLDDQKKQLEEHEQKAKELGDPEFYEKNASEQFDTFIEKLPELKLTDYINKKPNEFHVGIIGAISAGKTTLINTMFNKTLPTALSHCTKTCEVVHSENNIFIWDVGGKNSDYKFYNPESLSFIKSLDMCIILFDNDIAMISDILKVVHVLNPKSMVLVRTKVDQYNALNIRTIKEEKELDIQKVEELLHATAEIFCISSLNVVNKSLEMYEWNLLKNRIFVKK